MTLQTNRNKKWLTASLCLLIAVSTASALQSGDFSYEINPGGTTVTITNHTGASGSLVIPSTIESKLVINIGSSAFLNCTSITNITIPDSVTSIGSSAFLNCTNITNITIPDSITSVGASAFKDCTGP